MDKSTGSFQKISNARVWFFLMFSESSFIFSLCFQFYALTQAVDEGPRLFEQKYLYTAANIVNFFLSGWLGKKRTCSTMFAKSKGRVSLGRRVLQWDCQYASIFEGTDFSRQNCTCTGRNAFNYIEFDNFIYSCAKCL